MRLAFVSPVNPIRSGISDYSEALLRALAHHCDLDLFVDGYAPSNPWIAANISTIDCGREGARRLLPTYDCILYQMGGTPSHHEYIYNLMAGYPGIVTLHDLIYQGFFGDLWLKTGKVQRFIDEMRDSHGLDGENVARTIIAGKPLPAEAVRRFPMNKSIIEAAEGIVVHSESALTDVLAVKPHARHRLIAHHDFGWSAWVENGFDPEAAKLMAKDKLGIGRQTKVLACFGFIVATKRPEVVLHAFRRLKQKIRESVLIFVGEEKHRISEYVRFWGLEESVRIVGYVTPDEFRTYLEATDVCINLRYPSQGETSGAVLRMLALGKPVIVTNDGWFAELPDDACAKTEADGFEEDLLYEHCKALLVDPAHHRQMSANAHEYAQRCCSLEAVGREYVDFLHECGARG